MKAVITKRIVFHLVLIVLLAVTMASHSRGLWPGDDWHGRVGYFILRFSLEAIEFLGCYFLLSAAFKRLNSWATLTFAFLMSWPVFVLSITMTDIIFGHPELEGASLYGDKSVLISMFLEEMYWILPKHLSFCALIALIKFRLEYGNLFDFRFGICDKREPNTLSFSHDIESNTSNTLINALSQRYREIPLRVQAQEHYTKVTTCLGTELILYQFGQALVNMKDLNGVQVHRSYWVAAENIIGWTRQKNNIQLELKFGDPVPVSRRFEQVIREHYLLLGE